MVKPVWQKVIDPEHCFVIAEAGVNHNGELKIAKKMVDVAAEAGADAIKFQSFHAEELVTDEAPKAAYQKKNTKSGGSQLSMLKKLELSAADQFELYEYCLDKKINFLSTPFDIKSADFLNKLGLKVFKIPSGEITNIPFLIHVAKKGKPMIVSTGMALMDEIELAVKSIRATGNKDLVLLHCVSDYPTSPEDVHLSFMRTLAQKFHVPVGFSDHTLGLEVPLAAVALGACVIEKHFTLNTDEEGPDHKISLDPKQLKELVRGIRNVQVALGVGERKPTETEIHTAALVRKSLVAAVDIKAGTVVTEAMIAVKRPGTGLPPVMRSSLLGKTAKVNIGKDKLLSLEMFT